MLKKGGEIKSTMSEKDENLNNGSLHLYLLLQQPLPQKKGKKTKAKTNLT